MGPELFDGQGGGAVVDGPVGYALVVVHPLYADGGLEFFCGRGLEEHSFSGVVFDGNRGLLEGAGDAGGAAAAEVVGVSQVGGNINVGLGEAEFEFVVYAIGEGEVGAGHGYAFAV